MLFIARVQLVDVLTVGQNKEQDYDAQPRMDDKPQRSREADDSKIQGYDVPPPISRETLEANGGADNIGIQDPERREENRTQIEKDKNSRKRNCLACCETAFCLSLGVSVCQGCCCF